MNNEQNKLNNKEESKKQQPNIISNNPPEENSSQTKSPVTAVHTKDLINKDMNVIHTIKETNDKFTDICFGVNYII